MSEMDDLTSLLYPKSMEGKVRWKLDGDDRIYSSQGENIIEIFQEDFVRTRISVRNKDGVVLVTESFSSDESSYDKLESIIIRARRSALKVDEILSDIQTRLRAL